MEDEAKGVKKKWTKVKIFQTAMLSVIVVGLITAACIYGYFVNYYSSHFYEGTMVNGLDFSDLTEEQGEALLQQKINEWEIKVLEREGASEIINAEQISMTYENDGSLKDLYIAQQPLLWGIRLFGDKTYDVPSGFTYDEDALRSLFDDFKDVREFVPVKDAELVQNEDGTWRIDPEVVGTEMNQTAAYEALQEAVVTQKEELDLEEYYKNPKVYAEDEKLVDEMEERNVIFSLTRAVIYVQFGNDQIIIDENMLRDWLVEDKTERYRIDEEKVRQFVQGLYDTYNAGHEGQLFKTKNGKVLTLEIFETEGWNMDVEKSCERYLKAIQEGYQGVLGPVMTRLDGEGNDTGNLYVEISVDEQMMWLMVDGEPKVETPIVTGGADEPDASNLPVEYLIAEFNSRSTPTNGIWTIKKKQSPHFMKGPMLSNGRYEYTLDVTYWLPFNDLIGIHDNYQRVDYGGTIYQTSGSHGCINTPYDAVEEIYNTVSPGTMVIVYGMDKGEDVFAPKPESEEEPEEQDQQQKMTAEEAAEEAA
ncbi:MAG: L,D-transpeptidase family protein [Lachnospiraceae bacterium]|nr:L,D-transpeptidase family protein [Lachnospiraceae bacterium]